jgi:two-component system phosphate regulon sensor histidine kinase PhoR
MNSTKISLLFESLPEPLLVVGLDNKINVANRAACEILGERLVDMSVYVAIRQPEAVSALERAMALPRNSSTRIEARFVIVDAGVETIFRMVASRIDPDTGVDGVAVTFLDVSHIEEAEQMRRDFVANVSHELRSPLTVLTGFIETLRGAARDDAVARERFLEIMENEATRMNRLVGDLLSLSRVEANERVRPRVLVTIADVLSNTLAALRPQIDDMSIELVLDDAVPGVQVLGDRDQLVQVFHNLIENAIKYGGAGRRVTVLVKSHKITPGGTVPMLAIDVTDQGDGIAALHLPRLTERFYRVDTHRSREMGGTGLGLAIVKHILNRHRGRLTIRSVKGQGSTFTAVLPIATSQTAEHSGK